MNFEDHKQIEFFLKNELSKEERVRFLERMETDSSFKEKVVFEQQLFALLNDKNWSYATRKERNDILDYKKILKDPETQKIKLSIADAQKIYKDSNKQKKQLFNATRVRWQWVTGIAAIAILSFSLFQYLTPTKVDYSPMLTAAWNKKIGLDFVVRNSDSSNHVIEHLNALKMFENKQYDSLSSVLASYDDKSANYQNVLLLKALTRYKLKQTTNAIKTLDTLSQYSADISKWYKGLMYLEAGNLDKAKLFIEVPNKNTEQIRYKE